jgi:hypothetical protein
MKYSKDSIADTTSLNDIIDENKCAFKRNYKDFLVFNGKLLIAEVVSSVTGAVTGEILSDSIENKLLVTGGTMVGDGVGYLGTYAFTDYLERKGAFAKHIGKFGIAYAVSGGASLVIKFLVTYYLNKEGYSGGEAALLARIPATSTFLLLMNILGYKMGLVKKEKTNKLKKTL